MRTNEFVGIIARGTSGRLMAGVEFTLSFTSLCRKPPLNVGIADGDSTAGWVANGVCRTDI